MEPTEERKHLTEIILGLNSCSKQYFACQILHLADLLQQRSHSLIPILRFGYLISKGHLSEKEVVAFLTPLYREARGKTPCPILEILARSKDPRWLKEELQKAAENHFGEDIKRPVEEEAHNESSDDPSDDSDGAPETIPMSGPAGVSSQSAARG